MSDDLKFLSDASDVRVLVGKFLKEWFGERCSEFDENCECCKRWKMLDAITSE